MVFEVNARDVAEISALRSYCWRNQRIIECYPDHPKWSSLVSIVSAASRAPVDPAWVRISQYGVSWLLGTGVYGQIDWREFRPDYSTDWMDVRKGAARAAIKEARSLARGREKQGEFIDVVRRTRPKGKAGKRRGG